MKEYLEINTSYEEAINLIKEAIRSNTPFAFSRFGDGHLHVLKRTSQEAIQNCIAAGYKYPEELESFYMSCTNMAKKAFGKSDLIGLMDPKTKLVDLKIKPEDWGLEKEIVSSWNVDPEGLKICDMMLARSKEMGSIEGMKELLQGQAIHVISPYTRLMERRKLSELLEVEVKYIEHPFSIQYQNRECMMKSFSRIKSNVVIVGTGFQKDYCVYLKENFGKIALDLGATLDAWSGKISKPWFQKNGLQEHCVIKLNNKKQ